MQVAATSSLESVDSRNQVDDLSGTNSTAYANPYDAMIEACGNDPEAQLQARYATHCMTRNTQQRAKLLSPEFSGLILDPILQRLVDPTIEPGFKDPRYCLVFWARPPTHIRSLINKIQQRLLPLAPNMWPMPLPRLHLTALEIAFSLTEPQTESIISNFGEETIATMTDYTYTHRPRLIKPILSYDCAAMALSFLPAAGEGLSDCQPSPPGERTKADDAYTYHHLRRDLFAIASKAGMSVDSRYVVPSSHITIGRFISQQDHDTPGKMQAWIRKIDEINVWLQQEYWPKDGKERNKEGEWIVGQEKGLVLKKGTLWYGDGTTVRLGRGF